MSTSYGQDEASVTRAYAQRQCTEYAKLGLLGTTVRYSSGDDGVAGNDGICLDGNGITAFSMHGLLAFLTTSLKAIR